jgi:hypothetical protein
VTGFAAILARSAIAPSRALEHAGDTVCVRREGGMTVNELLILAVLLIAIALLVLILQL